MNNSKKRRYTDSLGPWRSESKTKRRQYNPPSEAENLLIKEKIQTTKAFIEEYKNSLSKFESINQHKTKNKSQSKLILKK